MIESFYVSQISSSDHAHRVNMVLLSCISPVHQVMTVGVVTQVRRNRNFNGLLAFDQRYS